MVRDRTRSGAGAIDPLQKRSRPRLSVENSDPGVINAEKMPAPEPNPNRPRRSGGLDTLVKAEKLTQIAVVMPAAVLIGWGAGALLDKWLHQHWIAIAGLILGAVAGLVEAVRQALRAR
jgi:ATP synthase protein I